MPRKSSQLDKELLPPGITIHGNRFLISFYYKGAKCRESMALTLTKSNLKSVEKKRSGILYEIEHGNFIYEKHFPNSKTKTFRMFSSSENRVKKSVKDHLEDWLDGHKKQLSVSTYKDYKKMMACHILPVFGKKFVDELTVNDIKKWRGSLNIKNKSINNLCIPFRQAIEQAYLDKIVKENVFNYIKNLKVVTDEPDPYSISEMVKLLAAFKEDQVRNYFKFAFWSGLRQSELIELRWKDIDFEAGLVRVRRAMVRGVIKETKTFSSMRDVNMLGPAREALMDQRQYTQLQGEHIFQHPRTGRPWTCSQAIIKTDLPEAIKKSGVRRRPPRQTRHTYASIMLSSGEAPMWVAAQMGHKDWGMIRKRYGRWIPSIDSSAGSRAELLLNDEIKKNTDTM